MKKLILFTAIISVLNSSCKKESTIDYVVISGEILNKDMDSIGFVRTDRAVEGFRKKIFISENGSFRDTLFIESGHYNYFDGKRSFETYLEKGSQLNLSLDTKNFDNSIRITGEKVNIANYILAKQKKKGELLGEQNERFKLDEEAFLSKIENVKNNSISILKTDKNIPQNFIALETENINYEYLLDLVGYEVYHAYYTKKENFKVSNTYPDAIKNVAFDNADHYIFSEPYMQLVMGEHSRRAEMDSINNRVESILKEIATNPNEVIKNDLLYYVTRSVIENLKGEELKSAYTIFTNNSSNLTQKSKITEAYNNRIKTAKGSLSPKFVNYENHAGGTTSLDDLKGKYVYIDVWATWCGPCKAEIPFLKEVEKKYHGKNIEFVSISVDVAKKRDAWRAMVKEMELTGIQLIADKDFKSEFIKGYVINAIPRFLLIDPNGNILDSSAPRPSDLKLIELFDELNI